MNPIHKIAQFLREYETLCHKHHLIVDTQGFDYYDPVVKAATHEDIAAHIDKVLDWHKPFEKKK